MITVSDAVNVRHDALEWTFPQYPAAEVATDRVIHLLALAAAIVAVGWLFLRTVPAGDAKQVGAIAIYGCGLISMLTASAAYNLSRPCRRKELLRRLDHAMIFVMIAGTYTPFMVLALPGTDGLLLCSGIWSLALVGVGVILAFPRRFERPLLVLYLVMGWVGLGLGPKLLLYFSHPVLLLLLGGGAAYSVGALIHSRGRFPYQNAVWHGLVVLGAGVQWMAVVRLPPR